MAKQLFIVFIACFICYGLASCDRPECTHTNPIFASQQPDDEAYKQELIRVLSEEKAPLRYWLISYQEEENGESIRVYIQNAHVCAQGTFVVEDWTGMEGIRKSKGVGFRGAELAGFTYRVSPENILYFSSLTSIID